MTTFKADFFFLSANNIYTYLSLKDLHAYGVQFSRGLEFSCFNAQVYCIRCNKTTF